MSNSLGSDLSAFIDCRLEHAGLILKNSSDYKRQNDNIEKYTQKLLSAMPSELATTLGNMDDSYIELLNISERVCYRQGFKDALRLIANF